MRQALVSSGIIAVFIAGGVCFSQTPPGGRFFSEGAKAKKQIAITFDDGPSKATAEILNVLEAKGVTATFFILGCNIKGREGDVREIARRGHQVASHTYGHINFYRYTKPDARERLAGELRKTGALLQGLTGENPRVFRMPNGYYRAWVGETARELDLYVVHWTFGCDWKDLSSEELTQAYLQAVRPGAVLLFHDNSRRLAQRLEVISACIDKARAQGLSCVPVNEMFGLSPSASR